MSYLDKTKLLKQLSGSIIAFNIAHRNFGIFPFLFHCFKHKPNCCFSIAFSLIMLINEKLAEIISILFWVIQIHTHSYRSFIIIDIKHTGTELAV